MGSIKHLDDSALSKTGKPSNSDDTAKSSISPEATVETPHSQPINLGRLAGPGARGLRLGSVCTRNDRWSFLNSSSLADRDYGDTLGSLDGTLAPFEPSLGAETGPRKRTASDSPPTDDRRPSRKKHASTTNGVSPSNPASNKDVRLLDPARDFWDNQTSISAKLAPSRPESRGPPASSQSRVLPAQISKNGNGKLLREQGFAVRAPSSGDGEETSSSLVQTDRFALSGRPHAPPFMAPPARWVSAARPGVNSGPYFGPGCGRYGILRAIVQPTGALDYYGEYSRSPVESVGEYNKRRHGLDFVVVRYQFGNGLLEEGIWVLSPDLVADILSVKIYEGEDERHMVSVRLERTIASDSELPASKISNDLVVDTPVDKPAKLWCGKVFLYHHYDALDDLCASARGSSRSKALEVLLKYLAEYSLIKPEFELCRMHFGAGVVSAATAPYLFCPNQFALMRSSDLLGPDSVVFVDRAFGKLDFNSTEVSVVCWRWYFEADKLSRQELRHTLSFSQDTDTIRFLPLYPFSESGFRRLTVGLTLQHLLDRSGLTPLDRAVVRDCLSSGKKALELIQKPQVVECTGAWDLQKREYRRGSRFMVDYALKFQESETQNSVIRSGALSGGQNRRATNSHDPFPSVITLPLDQSNRQPLLLLLLPPSITALSLDNKGLQWCSIPTRSITTPTFHKSAIDSLTFPLNTNTRICLNALPWMYH